MRFLTICCLSFLFMPSAFSQSLQGDYSCDELWEARNQIYKESGYCFKTTKAIRRFGNARCSYDDIQDVPLSARQRREVAEIQQQERRYRCPR